jgi:hypothetical protein
MTLCFQSTILKARNKGNIATLSRYIFFAHLAMDVLGQLAACAAVMLDGGLLVKLRRNQQKANP